MPESAAINARQLHHAVGHHRKGIGEALLGELILEAERRGVGLCLNVRDSNPAIRLYERVGFWRVPGTEVKNRTGGLSFGMQLRKP